MEKLTVALLSGGVSSERAVSIKGGDQVYEALDKNKYNVVRYDPAADLKRLVAEASDLDVAFVVLHGPFGEDGTVQGLLDLLQIPYQGSGVLASAVAMDKVVSKRLYQEAGLRVPPFQIIERGETVDPEQFVRTPGYPLIVKPRQGGSSVGTHVVFEPDALAEAVDQALEFDSCVMAEAYLEGTEITGAILGNAELEHLPLVEIVPAAAYEFFDYTAKYTDGATKEICPARIDEGLSRQAQLIAEQAHRALCCKGYSRTDMIVQQNDIFVLETNTIPGMTPVSLFPLAAREAGFAFPSLLDRLIELALETKASRK
jgi:D-alanine-D-alanine ligase